MLLKLDHVDFRHSTAAEPLFADLNLCFSRGWTGLVGPNGSGKTTLLELACGLRHPTQGSVNREGLVRLCPQRTDSQPEELEDLLQTRDPGGCRIRGRLELGLDWAGRWSCLSHGERKRAQIGVALWHGPDILALDEPTNHIDAHARELLREALGEFRGIGLLVSHDRALLDSLCSSCLFLEARGPRLRPGGYSQGRAQAELELETAMAAREELTRELGRLEGSLAGRKRLAAQADRKRSKRGIPAGDHDAKARINLARLTGKDGRSGRLAAQLETRTRTLREELDRLPRAGAPNVGIWLPGSRSNRSRLFHLPACDLSLDSGNKLELPLLELGPGDRVGITGRNGAGKTSLVRHILRNLAIPSSQVLYLPQEVDRDLGLEVLERARALSRDRLGLVLTIIARLGSSAAGLLDSAMPSPGELRKLLLALGILESPHLVVMDEPTNHLDLIALECLEAALGDCPAGLMLVSHDLTFLRHLVSTRWHIADSRVQVLDFT